MKEQQLSETIQLLQVSSFSVKKNLLPLIPSIKNLSSLSCLGNNLGPIQDLAYVYIHFITHSTLSGVAIKLWQFRSKFHRSVTANLFHGRFSRALPPKDYTYKWCGNGYVYGEGGKTNEDGKRRPIYRLKHFFQDREIYFRKVRYEN